MFKAAGQNLEFVLKQVATLDKSGMTTFVRCLKALDPSPGYHVLLFWKRVTAGRNTFVTCLAPLFCFFSNSRLQDAH